MDHFRFSVSPEMPKFEDAPPMPDHWRIGEGTRFPRLKTVFLFIGVGRRTTEEFWARSYPGSPFYQLGRDEMRDRIAHINIVVSAKHLSSGSLSSIPNLSFFRASKPRMC
jgi:hypothetical protein